MTALAVSVEQVWAWLADVPDPAIHDPEAAGCKPDAYPSKIIGHREARERALAAGRKVR